MCMPMPMCNILGQVVSKCLSLVLNNLDAMTLCRLKPRKEVCHVCMPVIVSTPSLVC